MSKPVAIKNPADIIIHQVKEAYRIGLTGTAIAKLNELSQLVEYFNDQAHLAKDIRITDEATNAYGAELLVNLRKARKAGEELQKFFTKPLNDAKSDVISTFRNLGADAAAQEARLDTEAKAWFLKKLNAQREEQEKQLAAEQAAAAKARQTGRGVPPPFRPAEPASVERTINAEYGTVSMRPVFKADFTQVSLDLVPRQYLILDERKVNAAVESGVREIPGIVIKETVESRVR